MTRPDIPVTIDAGVYWVALACPQCGGTEHVLIELTPRLTVDEDSATIRPRLRGKSADHICEQSSIHVDADIRPADDQPALTDDQDDA